MTSASGFTDKDILRLKEEVEEDPGINHDVSMRRDRMEALLARLAAAEAYIATVATDGNLGAFDEDAYRVWRRSAGK